MLTTKQAIAKIKKHRGDVIVDAKIGDFGIWVTIAKTELIRQLVHVYGTPNLDSTNEWLDLRVDDNGDLQVSYEQY